MKTLIVILFLFITYASIAQREDHKWYFGNTNLGLFFDYNNNAVSITHEHAAMNYAGSYSVACDNNTGQLMFYTDGNKIWDKNHLVMPNGSGLTNGAHPMQTGLICYYPDHSNHLFVFSTTSDYLNAGNLYYSEIDMSLVGNGTVSNPSGNVVSGVKNVLLCNQTTEGMKIIVGAVNCYWLIVPQINSTNIRVFKVDNNGINLNSTYNIGLNVGIVSYTEYSSVSKKLAIANLNGNQSSIVMDFNETTGQITNCTAIPGTSFSGSGICAVEWSPSGQLLYLSRYRNSSNSTSGQLLQYNTNTPSTAAIVIATLLPISNTTISKGLKLAPDGKIYHVWGVNSNTYLGAVNNPDLVGLSCNYNPNALNLGEALNYTQVLSEPLLPLNCEFSSSNSFINTDFVCRPSDITHTDISLINNINNPCNNNLTHQIVSVSNGTAAILGDNIQYFQPSSYVPTDTIIVVSCNTTGICDTCEIILNINYVGPTSPVISELNSTLYSGSIYSNQWYLNGSAILGATQSFYMPTETGYYTIKINDGLCSASSAPFYFIFTSINNSSVIITTINIYPNPVKDKLFIDGFDGCELRVTDALGKTLINTFNHGSIDVSSLINGIYFISIYDDQKEFHSKFLVNK